MSKNVGLEKECRRKKKKKQETPSQHVKTIKLSNTEGKVLDEEFGGKKMITTTKFR